MSKRYGYLLASGDEMDLVPSHSHQQAGMFDIHLLLYVQSWTPDDQWKDRPKHVVLNKNQWIWETGASGWFTIELYYDVRTYERQILQEWK
jgi:hypothetical protein